MHYTALSMLLVTTQLITAYESAQVCLRLDQRLIENSILHNTPQLTPFDYHVRTESIPADSQAASAVPLFMQFVQNYKMYADPDVLQRACLMQPKLHQEWTGFAGVFDQRLFGRAAFSKDLAGILEVFDLLKTPAQHKARQMILHIAAARHNFCKKLMPDGYFSLESASYYSSRLLRQVFERWQAEFEAHYIALTGSQLDDEVSDFSDDEAEELPLPEQTLSEHAQAIILHWSPNAAWCRNLSNPPTSIHTWCNSASGNNALAVACAHGTLGVIYLLSSPERINKVSVPHECPLLVALKKLQFKAANILLTTCGTHINFTPARCTGLCEALEQPLATIERTCLEYEKDHYKRQQSGKRLNRWQTEAFTDWLDANNNLLRALAVFIRDLRCYVPRNCIDKLNDIEKRACGIQTWIQRNGVYG